MYIYIYIYTKPIWSLNTFNGLHGLPATCLKEYTFVQFDYETVVAVSKLFS